MKTIILVLLISLNFLLSIIAFAFAQRQNENAGNGGWKWELAWSDEFSYTGRPDTTKWGFEEGFIRNREDQYYTGRSENVRVESGFLIIEACKEEFKNSSFTGKSDKDWRVNREYAHYTSASITTRNRAEWKYGKIEVRAKLPRGVGLWPAIWMLGENLPEAGWPKCGEIDIMEHVGFEPDSIFGTIHTKAYNHMIGTQKGEKVFIDDPYDDFHLYAIEWTPDRINFLLDNKVYYHVINEHKTDDEWPFDQPFHLKLNIAIGGGLGGIKGIDDSIFPQKMVVDYVRYFSYKQAG